MYEELKFCSKLKPASTLAVADGSFAAVTSSPTLALAANFIADSTVRESLFENVWLSDCCSVALSVRSSSSRVSLLDVSLNRTSSSMVIWPISRAGRGQICDPGVALGQAHLGAVGDLVAVGVGLDGRGAEERVLEPVGDGVAVAVLDRRVAVDLVELDGVGQPVVVGVVVAGVETQ